MASKDVSLCCWPLEQHRAVLAKVNIPAVSAELEQPEVVPSAGLNLCLLFERGKTAAPPAITDLISLDVNINDHIFFLVDICFVFCVTGAGWETEELHRLFRYVFNTLPNCSETLKPMHA